jgi:hypothetical protein
MPEIKDPQADGGAAAGNEPGDDKVVQPEPKKLEMTQEEFDRIIAERVARAKPKDYDDLVRLREEQSAAEEAKKTELQKEKDARAAAEAAAKERTAAADRKLIRAEILTESAAQKAADADIVYALLRDSEDITVDAVGTVSGAREAVARLLKSKPTLVAGAPSSSGGEFGGNDKQTVQEQITQLEQQGKFKEARDLKMSLVQIG